MRKSSRILKGAAFAALVALSAYGRSHNALNGTWTLVPEKSDFGGHPPLKAGIVTITDREGNITVDRSFEYQGASQTVFYSDATDGEHNATIRTESGVKSKTKWDHGALRVTTEQNGATTRELYTLAADGTMVVTVEKPEHRTVTLVFERK